MVINIQEQCARHINSTQALQVILKFYSVQPNVKQKTFRQ